MKGRKVIFTSIIPADLGDPGLILYIDDLNREIEAVVQKEGGFFLNLHDYFAKGNMINRNLYKLERDGYLHLNEHGGKTLMHLIESKVHELESFEKVFQMNLMRQQTR